MATSDTTKLSNDEGEINQSAKIFLRLKTTAFNKANEASGSSTDGKIFLRLPLPQPKDVFERIAQINRAKRRTHFDESSDEEEMPESAAKGDNIGASSTSVFRSDASTKKRILKKKQRRQAPNSTYKKYQQQYQQSETNKEKIQNYQRKYYTKYRTRVDDAEEPNEQPEEPEAELEDQFEPIIDQERVEREDNEEFDVGNNEDESDGSQNDNEDEIHEETPWEKSRKKYEKAIKEGPTTVCICCGGLFFLKNVSLLNKDTMLEKWKTDGYVVDAVYWPLDNGVYSNHTNITITKTGSGKHYFCANCKTSIKNNKIPTIALSNGLNFPAKVPCVSELTRLEERLVAPRHVFQSIWTHKGEHGQFKSKGGIANVSVNVDTTVSCLPRNYDASGVVHLSLVRKLIFKKDYIRGNVSPHKVWNAARYLQTTPLYTEYEVQLADQTEWDSTNLVVEENEDNNEGDEPNENTGENNDIEDEPLNPGATDSILSSDNDFTIRLAPGEGRVPLSILKDKDSDFLSFPKIFFGTKIEGLNSISYSSVTKSIARIFDRRAVERADYLFFMDRKTQLLKMSSNISTILRKRKNTDNGNMPFTAKDVGNTDNVNLLLSKDQAFKTLSGVRSSSEYWKNQKKNSMAMIRQHGVPTVFVTVSAAESKWNELLCVLKKIIDDDVMTEEQADTLSFAEKARLLQSDPVTAARYFDHRFRELKKTWAEKDGPFFGHEISEYFFRVEFQHRGSPHVHMLLWLKDAPVLEDKICENETEADDIKANICSFVDKIITCSKKWDGSPHHDAASKSNAETWKDLLRTRQTHRHTSTCRRKRGGNKVVCRFNIPFPPISCTTIMEPLDLTKYSAENIKHFKELNKRIMDYLDTNYKELSDYNTSLEEFLDFVDARSYNDYVLALRVNLKMNKLYIKREPNAIMINNYSPKIISMFRSNMDIQFILDPYACCAYVMDYINKSDRGMSKAMEEIYVNHKNNSDTNSTDMLRSLAAQYYNSSEISAQEAAYNLLGIRMVESSTVTIFVPTSRPTNRTHILKSQEELAKLNPDSTNCFVPGLIDHYTNRSDCLEDINLAQFAAYYEISRKSPKKKRNTSQEENDGDDNYDSNFSDINLPDVSGEDGPALDTLLGGPAGKVFVLKNDSGFLTRRAKSKVIRYYKFNLEKEPSEFFRTLIMLYKPWRDEEKELLDIIHEDVFNSNINLIMERKKEFCAIDDATLDMYMEQLNQETADNINGGSEDEENTEVPGDIINDFGRYTLDIDDSSEDNNQKTYLEKLKLPDRLSKAEFYELVCKLNTKEREYLTHIINHIRYNRDRVTIRMFSSDNESVRTFEPFRHFVTGGAGVGKSMLIKALYESINVEFDGERDTEINTPIVLLTAPTGKAAFNINGQTLHGAFQLPVNQYGSGGVNNLSADVSYSMAVALKDLKVLIIDEISMVGNIMFSWIDKRLRDIFDGSLPFGGKSVIVLGDFFQLPPVMSSPLFSTSLPKDPYLAAFGSNLWKDFKIHKLTQIMRQRDDLRFAIALNNMAIGEMTPNGIQLFQSRVLHMTEEEKTSLNNGQPIFPHLNVVRNFDQSNVERPICLFHTNAEVSLMNNAILDKMDTEGGVSVGFDRIIIGNKPKRFDVDRILASVSDDSTHRLKTLGLLKKLILKIGARYMIVVNIDTSDGLVNGSTGYLVKIDFGTLKNNPASEKKPLRIWLKSSDEKSGAIRRKSQVVLRQINGILDDTWTIIEPSSLIITSDHTTKLQVNRKQFPLVPAEALTTHKSQGGTYKDVVVYDTAKHRMKRSLIYVACSRATTAAGLTLICKNNKFIPPKALSSEKDSDLYKEIQRQPSITLSPTFTVLTTKSHFQVISHNVQSLNAHLNQIINDPVYLSSDIILLNETWTLPTDNFQIPGFQLKSSLNCSDSTRKPIGSCCYVSDSLVGDFSSSSRLFTNNYNTSTISVSIVIVTLTLYCSIYASPDSNQSPDMFLEALSFITEHDYIYIVIAGDFNLNFYQDSPKSTTVTSFLNQLGIKSSLPESVRSTTKQHTFIDNIFTNQAIIDSGRYISFTSHHDPLWLLT
ncbi:hypothetical protein INT47_004688 [Mucor saturninus]|uniref:ATP-dependent DNA helicase n=1 Tax=Mucor saturninus TaxID=64648 RepID=A0A8H7QIP3_9FUNG|nr:hypothetical protein INT47_004688 [Mucor saturninus]